MVMQMAAKQKIIFPGEALATEEEYSAGENTFIKNGKIVSKTLGIINANESAKEIGVKGKTVNEIQYGDTVIGKVMLVKESSATIELMSAENGKRITGINVAQLPIRNVSNEYVTELKKLIKIGDIVKAKIASINEYAIDLTTKGQGLGVVKAFCSNCRAELSHSNGKLMCLACGSVEDRKWFEKEDNQDFNRGPPREGGGFRGRGGFGGERRGFGGGGRRSFGPRRGGGNFGGGRRRF